ncbi:SPOR domain-containing protein [Acidovorax sp. Root402]|uniref:SPOR domain-containing protein n=1 Tax=Acidovorax sp. Root402 TaxID=1736527 RepID=UPI0006F4A5C5|nr:SPOR domain-containing protein [Acidovorax sp. Root402]KQW24838.1 sporulation protein [Acidovorax sp. Root402]
MAFFKFRWPGQGEQQQAEKPSKRPRTPQAESIEVMRRRARHRLIGAAVLVLVGVIGFPLLFDTQPRPIPVDIPIEIPDRNKVAPLVVPAPVAEATAAKPVAPSTPEPAPTAAAQRPAPSRNAAANGLADGEELVPSARTAAAKPAPAPAVAPPKPEVKHEAKPPAAPAPSPVPEPKPARADDSARARALLEGRSTEAPAAAGAEEARFIVQVGAFADAEKAREARTKVERAGLKTYMQVVDTKDGKRTRVRVGPFTNRAEADKAAARIKSLDLSASVLTL